MDLLSETFRSLRASPLFATFLVLTLAFVGLIGLMVAVMALGLGDILPGGFAQMGHFTEAEHRVHDLTYGLIFLPGIVGLLAQLARPSRNVAGMVMALVPWLGLLLSAGFGGTPFVFFSAQSLLPAVLTVFTALLHPAGRDFFRSFTMARVNWVMVGLIAIAAAPLLAFAFTNVELQRTIGDEHAEQGHYGFMAAFGLVVIGVAAVASLRANGWRLTAWVAGVLPILFGFISLFYPDRSSSLALVWALAAVTWGTAFIATAERAVGLDRSGLSPRTWVEERATSRL